jgi:hypothetical protein
MAGGWPFRHGRTVTVTVYDLDPRTKDRTPDPDRSAIVEACAFDPGSTAADVSTGVSVTIKPRLFGPYDLDVEPHATTIAIAGEPGEFEVDGEPLRHHNDLTGRYACSEIPLTRKRGPR